MIGILYNMDTYTKQMVYSKNKKAYFDYEVLEEFEAGIILEGWEVKSIKNSMADITPAYVVLKNGEAYLVNMHVSRWKTQSRTQPISESRDRKLLLSKREIEKLQQLRKNSGTSIVVLDLHSNKGMVKVKIGAARGRKKYDKRRKIKEKEMKKEIRERGRRW